MNRLCRWLMLFSLVVAGCGSEEVIHSYRVPKQDVVHELNHVAGAEQPQPAAAAGKRPERMLAATVLHEKDGWFFKLSGPPDLVAKQSESFDAFVRSLDFASGKPIWKLPDHWKQLPGREMRFATIEIDAGGQQPLELSVISLPRGDTEEQEYLLANVNRWRGQLALPVIAAAALKDELEKIEVPGATAYVTDIEGTASGGGMAKPPFAGNENPAPPLAKPQAAGVDDLGVKYDLPEGWQPGKPVMFSKASFVVTAGEQQAQVTISDLAAAAGDLLPNINRWRGQVGLPNQSQAELDAEMKTLPVAGEKGHYVVLEGPGKGGQPQTILGVIVQHSGKAWFIKLVGDASLAAKERERFEAFVKSLKFGPEGSGSNGN